MTSHFALESLARKSAQHSMIAIQGGNFSGRTALLRSATGLGELAGEVDDSSFSAPSRALYIGPEIYNSLSGLASTVRDELRIHGWDALRRTFIDELIQAGGLDTMFDRNPFVISGGEQACLALITGLLLEPELLALDGVLEQLAGELRSRVIKIIRDANAFESKILLSDNRLAELTEPIDTVLIEQLPHRRDSRGYLAIGSLQSAPVAELSRNSAKQIVLEGVSFRYPRGPEILHRASLTLDPQQPYLLVGKNGSGKTTFAKLLVGILKPQSGRLFIDGQGFKPWTDPGGVVGYHFQNPDLQLFETTVLSELRSSMRGRGPDSTKNEKEAELMLAAFGLAKLREHHPLALTFPFVLRKRVAIAATLSMRTQWVILDEPTLGQDLSSSQRIADIIRSLVKLGTGVIVISHAKGFGELLGGRQITLSNGIFSIS